MCVDNFQVVEPAGPVRLDLTIRNGGAVVLSMSVVWNSSALGHGGLFGSFGGPPAGPPIPGRAVACNPSKRGYLASYNYTGRVSGGRYSTTWTTGSHDALPPELEVVVGWSWAGGELLKQGSRGAS